MKNYLYILAIVLLPLQALAQSNKGGLKTFIQNAERDNIMGAAVVIKNSNSELIKSGATDFTGFLYLPNIEAGTYTISITYKGWLDIVRDIHISANSIWELRTEMIPCPLELTIFIKNAEQLNLRNVEVEVTGADSASNFGYSSKNGIGWVLTTVEKPDTVFLRHPLCSNIYFTLHGVSAYTKQEVVVMELNVLGKILKVFRKKDYYNKFGSKRID